MLTNANGKQKSSLHPRWGPLAIAGSREGRGLRLEFEELPVCVDSGVRKIAEGVSGRFPTDFRTTDSTKMALATELERSATGFPRKGGNLARAKPWPIEFEDLPSYKHLL